LSRGFKFHSIDLFGHADIETTLHEPFSIIMFGCDILHYLDETGIITGRRAREIKSFML